jgi:hypothetical protein
MTFEADGIVGLISFAGTKYVVVSGSFPFTEFIVIGNACMLSLVLGFSLEM